jgi:hypothetical protein
MLLKRGGDFFELVGWRREQLENASQLHCLTCPLKRPRRYSGIHFGWFLCAVDSPFVLTRLAEIEQGTADIVAEYRSLRAADRTSDGAWLVRDRVRHRETRGFLRQDARQQAGRQTGGTTITPRTNGAGGYFVIQSRTANSQPCVLGAYV